MLSSCNSNSFAVISPLPSASISSNTFFTNDSNSETVNCARKWSCNAFENSSKFNAPFPSESIFSKECSSFAFVRFTACALRAVAALASASFESALSGSLLLKLDEILFRIDNCEYDTRKSMSWITADTLRDPRFTSLWDSEFTVTLISSSISR